MLELIVRLLGLPVLNTLADAYKAKLAAGNTQENIAMQLAARELVVQQAELQAQYQLRTAEVGRWYAPENWGLYLVLLYMAKIIVWDTMLGWGETPAIGGHVALWMNLVISWFYGKRTFENVSRIWTRK
jgi:hypothetical protein